jgi:UPF0176 protein
MPTSSSVANLAVYAFAAVEDPQSLRLHLHEVGKQHALRGSIIVAFEGVNAFLAGEQSALESWLDLLQQRLQPEKIEAKWSYSDSVPFNRLASKCKPEIVTFRQGELGEAPRIDARTLRAWLTDNPDLLLLDTRNVFEYEQGSFEGAVQLGNHDFVEFAEKIAASPEDWKQRTVVTFCTGGIRCEKAAPFMQGLGFERVYQLDGGILRYFEDVGGEHWRGSCFVFDQRVGVLPDLSPVQPTPPQPKRPKDGE